MAVVAPCPEFHVPGVSPREPEWRPKLRPLDHPLPESAASSARVAEAPQAGRVGGLGWRRGRLGVGLLLVFLAVFIGTFSLRQADATVPVLVAARDLPSGVPLTDGDVRAVRVRLPDEQLRAYTSPEAEGVVGGTLSAPVPAGELLPSGLLTPSGKPLDLTDYPVPVESTAVPDLSAGDRVAVAVSYSSGPRQGTGEILLPSTEVVRVIRDRNALGDDGPIAAVQVRVPKDRLAEVAGAVADGRVSIARLAPGDKTGTAPATDEPAAPPQEG